ncbi:MAG: Crp/Fnr family transcriptional regulator [Burkholderiaceae bacterium]
MTPTSFLLPHAELIAMLEQVVPVQRRVVRAGDALYRAGDTFANLFLLNSGFVKVINLSRDGREQLVALNLKGDWLGLDGLANGQYRSDAIAMDVGEIWQINYQQLMNACIRTPALLGALHAAMSRELSHDRNAKMSMCTLSADARVADFLHGWAADLECRGMRADQITLQLTRAEIGNYLGLTLETVSRALSRLARLGLIGFDDRGRRDIRIPDVDALLSYAERPLGNAAKERRAAAGAHSVSRAVGTNHVLTAAERRIAPIRRPAARPRTEAVPLAA